MTIKQAVARPAELSQEFVQDSEGEESERGDNVTSEAIGVVQKNKRPANKSTSNGTEVTPAQESEAASDSESSGSSQASSTSENGRGESDGGQSTASDDSRKRSRPSEISQPSKKQKKSNGTTPKRIPSKSFKPPLGFQPHELDASDFAFDAAKIFLDLSNKQVWHISAPASVNIGTIKRFDISAALKGNPITTQNGVSYSLQPTATSNGRLLLPDGDKGAYFPSETTISRGFQLKAIEKEVAQANSASSQDDANPDITNNLIFTAQSSGQPKPPRQQPTGLETRYVPYGVVERERSKRPVRPISSTADSGDGRSATMNMARRRSKSGSEVISNGSDLMEIDENPSAGSTSLKSPPRAVDVSPAKSSVPETPRDKQKKKKKSRLVDDSGL